MQQLTKIRNDIHTALKHQELAEAELKLAQKAYDEKLAEFEAQNSELVTRRDKAIVNYDKANLSLSLTRAQAGKALSEDFINDLPEGLSQELVQTVVYDPQGFRRQALEFFPFLLKLDTEATDKFFKAMVDENNMIPEHIRSLCSVMVFNAINPVIDDEAIKNLQIVQNHDLSLFADALLSIEENSPADESQFVKDVYQRQVVQPIYDETATNGDETVIPSEDLYS